MIAIETDLHPFVEAARCVVALPVAGPDIDLDQCLNALFSQTDRHGRPLNEGDVIVVIAHDGNEITGRVVRRWQERMPETLHLFDYGSLARAGDGAVRMLALEAAAMVGDDRPILMTEPTVVVALDWAAANLAVLRGEVDMVAGDVQPTAPVDPVEADYRALLTEIDARLDPQAHDPWPRHDGFSFASMAIRPSLLARPELRLIIESGVFSAARMLRQTGLRLRHALDVIVTGDAEFAGIAALEPAFRAFSRARWRGEMRRHHAQGADVVSAWEHRLRVQPGALCTEWRQCGFDALWDRAEQISPLLARRRLHAADLPEEMRQAANLLGGLRSADAPRPAAERTRRPAAQQAMRRAAAAA